LYKLFFYYLKVLLLFTACESGIGSFFESQSLFKEHNIVLYIDDIIINCAEGLKVIFSRILSNKLFDNQHSCISNGVIYLEDSQEQGI